MAVIDEINDLIKELKEDNVIDAKQISDTHHTFENLYFQRVILQSKLCNCYKDLSWRTKKHFDEIAELDHAPKWDDSLPNENILRVLSLPDKDKNKTKIKNF